MKTVIKHAYMNDLSAKCPSCGCEFNYEQEDIDIVYSYEQTSPFTALWPVEKTFVTCPDCNYSIMIIQPTRINPSNIIIENGESDD